MKLLDLQTWPRAKVFPLARNWDEDRENTLVGAAVALKFGQAEDACLFATKLPADRSVLAVTGEI